MSRRGRASAACRANARPSASDKTPRPCDADSSCRYDRFIGLSSKVELAKIDPPGILFRQQFSVLRIHRFHRFLRFLASSKSGRIEGIENVESKVFSSLDSTYSIHSVLRISITCKHKQDYGTVWISDKKKKNPARFEFSVDAAVVLSLSLALSLSLSLSTECPFHAAPSPIRPATHVDR